MHLWHNEGKVQTLKAGTRVHGVNSTNKIWTTCCALHNLLIDIDGLSVEWNGEMGLHDQEEGDDIPFALRRLQRVLSTEIMIPLVWDQVLLIELILLMMTMHQIILIDC